MRLTPRLYLVGSGEVGLSDPDDCHVYLLDGGGEYALIDAGCGSERSVASILGTIEREGLDPARLRTIILTHCHFDHAGGANIFRKRFGCRVIAPAGERAIIERGRDIVPPIAVDRAVDDGDTIQVGALTLTAHCVPSHSEATTAYRVDTPEGRLLFAGDIVFANGVIGLINYTGSDLANYRAYIGRLGGAGHRRAAARPPSLHPRERPAPHRRGDQAAHRGICAVQHRAERRVVFFRKG